MKSIIYFYRVADEYEELSNFARYEIILDGQRWPTTEYYFQAQKFRDQPYREKIRKTTSPMQAALLGRDHKQRLRNDWESIKDNVMKKALMAKFTQHEALRTLLQSTREAKLVEHTENDNHWGAGGNGKGKNRLGQLLMDIRSTIKNHEAAFQFLI